MIEFDERIRAIIYVPFADRADYLAAVSDNPDGPGFVVTGRLRFYADGLGDPFDDRDRKRWFQSLSQQPLEETIEKARQAGAMLAMFSGLVGELTGRVEFYTLVRGEMTLDRFVDKWRAAPFVHERRHQ